MNKQKLAEELALMGVKPEYAEWVKQRDELRNSSQIYTKIKEELELLKSIMHLIEQSVRMKNAYFWAPPMRAADRRSYEDKRSVPEITWRDGKDIYRGELRVSCSCKNIYVYKYFYKNDKETNLTAIKNSYKRKVAEMIAEDAVESYEV